MSGILCSMVGATFVTAVAEVIRKKTSLIAAGSTTSTTQSKFGGSSAIFNGSSQYINVPHQSQLDLSGYSDWTIEGWFYFTEPTSRTAFNKDGITGSAYPGYTIYTNASKQPIFGVGGSAGNWVTITGSSALSSTTWYHFAAVKSGSTITFYRDGTSIGTTTYVGYTDQGRPLYIGWESNGAYMYGHIDEFRISKIARYTTTFTPSTTAFANDDDTVLLVHFDGTNGSTYFEDDNGVRSQRSIIATGNAQIDTAQSKFGGSSYQGDGTGDYLTVREASNFNFGSSDFTIECWMRFNNFSSIRVPIASRGGAGIGNGDWWCELGTNGKIYWGFKNQAGTQYYANLSQAESAFSTGVWYHIALVRSGTGVTYYRDGVATGGATTVTGSFGGNDFVYVGALGPGGYSLDGYIDEVRISNTARYTANFTPATEPFVNDSNTLLLMHMDGTDSITTFRDDNGVRTQKSVIAIANAQIDTAQSYFGGSSAYFDGVQDRLQIATNDGIFFTGDFTIEMWMRSGNETGMIFGNVATNVSPAAGQVICYYSPSPQRLEIYFNGQSVLTTNTTIAINTWYHIAMVRSGSTVKVYVNGTEQSSTKTVTGDIGTSTYPTWYIGGLTNDADCMLGHLDEIRFSKSARYTANFTPATAPFQNDSNTVLLLHMDGTDGSTVFFDDNGRTTTP